MDATIIGAMIGLLGIVVAAVFGSVGYLYRTLSEHKRSARRVLYLLLEIRHAVFSSLLDPEDATNKYILHYLTKLRSRGLLSPEDDFPQALRDVILEHFENMFSSFKTSIETRLLALYEDALLELSAINPTLAHRLRGKEKLEKGIFHTNQYREKLTEKFIISVQEEWARRMLAELSDETEKRAFTEVLIDLDKDIYFLARKCGLSVYLKCKRLLKRHSNPNYTESFEEVDQLMDSLLDRFSIAIKKHQVKS